MNMQRLSDEQMIDYYSKLIKELAFWRDVFRTFAEINGTKVKSDKQIIKWLKNPHSDSAEYKMWGNGVCLNVVIFVLSRIVKYAQ